MKFLLIPIALCSILGIRFQKSGFREDYLSIASTTAINGIFTLLVLFRHIKGSLNSISSAGEQVAMSAGGGITKYFNLGQLIVVTFLFFSGYAIAESIRKKPDYLRSMAKNRLLKVWLHFAVVLIVYLIAGILMGSEFSAGRILLSFTGFQSLGNSNWYIFDILCLYVFTIVAFRITKRSFVWGAAVVTGLTVVFAAVLYLTKTSSVFYDTVILYPLGIWFSLLKPRFDAFCKKSALRYLTALAASLLLFGGCHILWQYFDQIVFFEIECFFMMLSVILLMMKFKVGNPVLLWLGKNLFWIYILQRLPMNVMNRYFPDINKYAYIAITVAVTVALTFGFSAAFKPIDKKLFAKKAGQTP